VLSRLQVEEFKQGDGAAAAPAATPAQAAAAAQAAAKPAAAPTSILAPQEPLKPPEDEQYTVHVPEGLRLQVQSTPCISLFEGPALNCVGSIPQWKTTKHG
jgi:hypothetical protein